MSIDAPVSVPPPHQILVVDDEQDTVDMVLRMVRGSYEAVGTTSAQQALTWIEHHQFDAVVADQRLRDGTGTSVLARCAALAPLCRRIAISGQAEMGDLVAAVNVGKVSRFVMKPFDRDVLLGALSQVLAEYEAERAELERALIDRSERAGERTQVAERRGGRRNRRGRPTHWPVGPGVRPAAYEDPDPLLQLFDPEVEIALASLSPDRDLDDADAWAWAAEFELRLVTRLRDTDQAFRLPGAHFVVVFAHTQLEGCRRACRRLGDGLPGGLRVDLAAWPDPAGRTIDPRVLVERMLRG